MLVAGCGGADEPDDSRPGAKKITADTTLQELCDGSHFSDGAAYEGSSHPLRVFWTGEPGDGSLPGLRPIDAAAPWHAWAVGDARTVQLLGCPRDGAQVSTGRNCLMDEALSLPGTGARSLPLVLQQVTFEIHEVRTGRKLAQVPVRPAASQCPAICKPAPIPGAPAPTSVVVGPTQVEILQALLPQTQATPPAR